jgi:hypothetical protein
MNQMEFTTKRRAIGAFSILGFMLWLGAVFYACTDDFGVEADFFKGTLKGELRITTVVPKNTDEIRVALAKDFPPSNFLELLVSEKILVDASETVTSQIVSYDMQVPLGDYEAAFVIWKELGQSWRITDIVGAYGDLATFQFEKITLTDEDPVADSVDIDINLNRVNRNAKIEGHIEFIGEWPVNTAAVALVAFKTLDISKALPEIAILPKNVDAYDYQIKLNADSTGTTLELVSVAWLPEGANLLDFKFLGVYSDPDSPEVPVKVVIKPGETVTGIDIVADFANIK